MSRLSGEQVKIGYGDSTIINNLDVAIPDGKVTSIIGPNGCGKSIQLILNKFKYSEFLIYLYS